MHESEFVRLPNYRRVSRLAIQQAELIERDFHRYRYQCHRKRLKTGIASYQPDSYTGKAFSRPAPSILAISDAVLARLLGLVHGHVGFG
jgi:hypothetical protein